jgi:hypothetical protein
MWEFENLRMIFKEPQQQFSDHQIIKFSNCSNGKQTDIRIQQIDQGYKPC